MPTFRGRPILAGAAGLAVLLLGNRLGVWWLGATTFASDAFYDGWAALLTLAVPAFFGGLLLGLLARAGGLSVAALTFGAFGLVGLVRPLWRIPLVSPRSAHSGLMHYFLYSPLVALAFGAFGAWLGEQFSTGRFSLADPAPVYPSEPEE